MRYIYLSAFLSCLTIVLLNGQPSSDMKGGFVKRQQAACLPESMRVQIRKDIEDNIALYALNDKHSTGIAPTDLIFPLVMPDPPPGYFHFSSISNYVDHDPSSGIEDFHCLANSYDGHDGTDYFTHPFEWLLVADDLVHVVSATDGIIILKNDGNPHDNCVRGGSWNAVYVQHDDGSQFWYGHLKAGSLTAKIVGERVEQGEYLGVVASSGYSNAPHLHLECYDVDGNLLDPYQGTCNSLNTFSMWDVQQPYRTPKINALLTHSEQPNLDCGPDSEISALSNTFYIGDTFYVGIYITDYNQDDIVTTDLLRPDQSLHSTFNSFSFENSYESMWNWRRHIFTEDDPAGTWTLEAAYKNGARAHTFEFIKQVTSVGEDQIDLEIWPNPTQGVLHITGLPRLGGTYQLFDLSGRFTRGGRIVDNRISFDGCPSGIYHLQIKQGGRAWHKKIIFN